MTHFYEAYNLLAILNAVSEIPIAASGCIFGYDSYLLIS